METGKHVFAYSPNIYLFLQKRRVRIKYHAIGEGRGVTSSGDILCCVVGAVVGFSFFPQIAR